MPENNKKDDNPSRDSLALIVGGIFVLGLIFAAYTYFNQGSGLLDRIRRNVQKVEDTLSTNTQRETTPSTQENQPSKPTSQEGQGGSSISGGGTGNSEATGAIWVPNNYNPGDIKGSTYTVVRGDTLWEIAEAVYGDGTQWTKILQANSSSIGFLPNGQQALIIPGQVLNLP